MSGDDDDPDEVREAMTPDWLLAMHDKVVKGDAPKIVYMTSGADRPRADDDIADSDDAADDFVDAEKLVELWYGPRKSDAEQGRDMAKISNAERLARAVLMFFDPGEWNAGRREEWLAITGRDECSSKVLGDLAREVRAEEERR